MSDELFKQVFGHLEQTLGTIEKKLESSKVLNGGFERLMEKINTIEETQSKILNEVNQLKETIYHPDDGLYSRIKSTEKMNLERAHVIDKTLTEIKLNRDKDAQDVQELEKEFSESLTSVKTDLKKIDTLQPRLEDMEKWRSNVNKAFWAIIVPLFTLLGKVLYDLIRTHIQFK